ncbi:hypothetical protein ABLE93_24390 [Xanthobacter sp. KR7-65]|uniref:tetratricopeptide repeat protein n=1 Tax=Xanthobacter sp. KR7-65 TaxID=3156612 RepID=UPI0032B49D27
MIELLPNTDVINFGEVSDQVNALLQQGVIAYRKDRKRADELFRQALATAPTELPVYFCLYKIHTYQGNLDEAEAAAQGGLKEAASQAGWDLDWHKWHAYDILPEGAGRFALYTLKALAFINLRQNRPDEAAEKLEALKVLDPTGAVGWPVVAALAEGLD